MTKTRRDADSEEQTEKRRESCRIRDRAYKAAKSEEQRKQRQEKAKMREREKHADCRADTSTENAKKSFDEKVKSGPVFACTVCHHAIA